jgi:hypothetical protein
MLREDIVQGIEWMIHLMTPEVSSQRSVVFDQYWAGLDLAPSSTAVTA